MNATFHERQYELALNLEVIAGGGMFFAPMQGIEENVGYDIALVPGEAAIWSALGIAVPPVGVETPIEYSPGLEPVPGGQTFASSLFLQHKRPERMVRPNAAETPTRRALGGGIPFFRVRLNVDQHDVLSELEDRVGADAVVRYAAPLFHRIEDLWVRQATRDVLSGSVFVPPSWAGNPPSRWTYDDRGASIFCSEPRSEEAERRDDVLRAIVEAARSREWPRKVHLRTLASQVDEIDLTSKRRRRRIDDTFRERREAERVDETQWVRPPLARSEWADRLRSVAPEQADADIVAAVDAALIANTASAIGLTWLLAETRVRPS